MMKQVFARRICNRFQRSGALLHANRFYVGAIGYRGDRFLPGLKAVRWRYFSSNENLKIESARSKEPVIAQSQPLHLPEPKVFDESITIQSLQHLLQVMEESKEGNVYLRKRTLEKALKELAKSSDSFQNVEEITHLLKLLVERNTLIYKAPGLQSFLKEFFAALSIKHPIDDQQLLQIIVLLGKLDYRCIEETERVIITKLLSNIRNEIITVNFDTYCSFIFSIGYMRIKWQHLTKGKWLLSQLGSFGPVDQLRVPSAEKLIIGLNKLLIRRFAVQTMPTDLKIYYNNLLFHVLSAKYLKVHPTDEERKELKEDEVETPIAYAIVTELSAFRTSSLTPSQLNLIWSGLENDWNMKTILTAQLCLAIWSLGELGIHYKQVPQHLWSKMNDVWIRKFTRNHIDPHSLSLLCHGWNLMDYKWSVMENKLQSEVVYALTRASTGDYARELANVILYVGSMELDWSDIPSQNQTRLLNGIENNLRKFTAREFANTLLGLNRMNIKWKNFTEEMQNKLIEKIERTLKDMNTQEFSNILYSLGEMGLDWKLNLCHGTLQDKIVLKLTIDVPHFNEIELNCALNGLNNLKYDWTRKDQKLFKEILHRIDRLYKHDRKEWNNNQKLQSNLSQLLYNLGESKIRWKLIPERINSGLLKQIDLFCKQKSLDVKSISVMMNGLSNLQVSIYDLPPATKASFDDAISKVMVDGIETHQVATILLNLCNMEYSWSDLSQKTQQSLIKSIQALASDFELQGLCNVMYSLAVMVRDDRNEWRKDYSIPLHFALIQRLLVLNHGNKTLSNEAQSQLAVYFEWLNTFPPSFLAKLLQQLNLQTLPVVQNPFLPSASSTQLKFSKALTVRVHQRIERYFQEGKITEEQRRSLLNIRCIDEFKGLKSGIFCIDIAITLDDEGKAVLLFVEIDGNYHQHTKVKRRTADGKVEEILTIDTKDQLKEYLYRHYYKTVPLKRMSIQELDNSFDEKVEDVVDQLDLTAILPIKEDEKKQKKMKRDEKE